MQLYSGLLLCVWLVVSGDGVTKHDDDDDEGGRVLNEAQLTREVCVKLSETDTVWLLDMPSICVMNDSDEALEIVRQNSRYEQVNDS